MNVDFSNGFHGEGCLSLAQDSKGDITADDGHRAYTFKQHGNGRKDINNYKLTVVNQTDAPTGDACADLSGPAQLDATTNRISASLSGVFTCENVTASMTFSRGCS